MKINVKRTLTAIALVAPFVFTGQASAVQFCLQQNQKVIVEAEAATDGEAAPDADDGVIDADFKESK